MKMQTDAIEERARQRTSLLCVFVVGLLPVVGPSVPAAAKLGSLRTHSMQSMIYTVQTVRKPKSRINCYSGRPFLRCDRRVYVTCGYEMRGGACVLNCKLPGTMIPCR